MPEEALSGAALERRSRTLEAAQLAEAQARFAALPLAGQMAVARRVCATRQHDFARILGEVLALRPGLRRRRDAQGQEFIHREACVVFIVRRKRGAADDLDPAQRIPEFLLSSVAGPGGEARLVALPTDVQAQDRFTRIQAQAASGFTVQGPAGQEFGVAACVVESGSARYALAPLHVMTPQSAAPMAGLALRQPLLAAGSAAPLQSTAHGGRLVDDAQLCFDVQWAKVKQLAAVKKALGPQRWSASQPWQRGPDSLLQHIEAGRPMFLLLPDNHPQMATPRGPVELVLSQEESVIDIDYLIAGQLRALPQRVMELQLPPGQGSLPGDSGSPVVLALGAEGLSLVGMHVAGSTQDGTSYVIPAWRLLDPAYHADMQASTPGASWRLMNL